MVCLHSDGVQCCYRQISTNTCYRIEWGKPLSGEDVKVVHDQFHYEFQIGLLIQGGNMIDQMTLKI